MNAAHPAAGAAPAAFAAVVESWRPAPQVTEDVLGAWPARALGALLDAPAPAPGPGDPLPPFWHEVYLRPAPALTDLGDDGHPRHDALVPALPERRRMFGGGRLRVHRPLRVGDRVRKTSSVTSARTREGSSGWLLLVTERHELTVDGELRIADERDIVYRLPDDAARPAPGAGPAHSATAEYRPDGETVLRIRPDERTLFLVSALTYNAHRIHYDRRYTTEVEGHPDLVVHGPLLALAGMEAARRALGGDADAVDYRLVRPAYCGTEIGFAATADSPGTVAVTGYHAGGACLRLTATRSERTAP